MRTTLLFAVFCAGLVACGPSGKKPADDPSKGQEDKNDSKEKWEGATPEDVKSSKDNTPGTSSSASNGTDTTTGTGNTPTHQAPVEASGHRSDQYDKDATEIVLKRAARQVKANCGSSTDETGKAAGPWGKVTINVNLGHNGHSKGVTVPPPYDGTPPGRCITQAFSNLTFPPWGGSDAPVDWEVEIVKPAK